MNLPATQSVRLSFIKMLPPLLFAATISVPRTSDGSSCIEEHAGKPVACRADDVKVIQADKVRDMFGTPLSECVQGKTFTFIADFRVRTTANTRYDIGLYFATDGDPNGDGASSGTCSANILRDLHLDPQYPNAVTLGAAAAADLDGDACRDISSANGWRNIGGKIVTLRIDNVLCHDSDGDGKMNLPNCAAWSQDASRVCSSPEHAAPGSATDCGCDIAFNMPIAVTPATNRVADTDSPDTVSQSKKEPVILSETISYPEMHP
jgi:hypothetical protein